VGDPPRPPHSTALPVPCMRRRFDGRDESNRHRSPPAATSLTIRVMSTTLRCELRPVIMA
jgi:hypothetical protein